MQDPILKLEIAGHHPKTPGITRLLDGGASFGPVRADQMDRSDQYSLADVGILLYKYIL